MGITVGSGKIYSEKAEFDLPDQSGTLATEEYVGQHGGGSLDINGLAAADALDGTEEVPVFQGSNKKTTTQDIADLGSGGSGYLVATVTLNDAQFKALPSTPVQIIAAPGVGKVILVHAGVFISDTTAGGYTNLTDASGILTYDVDQRASAAIVWNAFINNQAKYVFCFAQETFTGGGEFDGLTVVFGRATSFIENSPIYIADNIAGGSDYTGGNAANTLKVKLYYTIEDV